RRALARAAGKDAAHRGHAADRLRRGLVDPPALGGRAAKRPRGGLRHEHRRDLPRRVAAAARRLSPDNTERRPGPRPALAARAARQRRRPLARPRLPRAHHRPRAARRALHEVGREPDLHRGMMRLAHLFVLAVAAYAIAQAGFSFAVWLVAGAVAHDFLL